MNVAQRSFARGELAPALYARTDLAGYAAGLRTCRNFIVQREGGISYRPGFDYIASVKTPSESPRLVKFVYAVDDALVLEFGDLYVRFYKNGAQVQSGIAAYEIVSPYAIADVDALRFAQLGNVLTIVHPSYAPRELTRTTDTSWAFSTIDFDPSIDGPLNLAVSGGAAAAGKAFVYVVTAVQEDTGQESFIGSVDTLAANFEPTAAAPVVMAWDVVAGAASYNLYRLEAFTGGFYGRIGSSPINSFYDVGYAADYATNPPEQRLPFDAAGDWPSVVGYYQQRRIFANTTNNPETVWASRIGDFANFRLSTPLQDDDPVTFEIANTDLAQIRHVLDLGRLIVGTAGSEYIIQGDASGTLTPTGINARSGSYNGANTLTPIKVGSVLLYVQSLGNKVLTARVNDTDGLYAFDSGDVTLYSTHLFDGYTIDEWDYQQIPNYLTWVVRSDGTLLGFTFLPEQEFAAWHRHDTAGTFERVCVIPEGGEHRVYVVVKRTIDGATVRYVERLRALPILDVVADSSFMDSAIEYDGRDASDGGTTLTLTGSGWTSDDQLTLTASASEFVSTDVGNARFLRATDGTEVQCIIVAYTGVTVVTVQPTTDVPVLLQGVACTDWDRAIAVMDGLDHLEGEPVAIFADGFVVASPNNPAVDAIAVDGGEVTLDQPYAHIRVGLPYLGDMETLDIDTPSGSSLKEENLNITRVGLWVRASRGIFAGFELPDADEDATEGLREVKIRQNESPTEPVELVTDFVKVDIKADWNSHGRMCVRQVDPVPLNILAAIPFGYLPGRN